MYSLKDFTMKDMVNCSGAIRMIGAGAMNMEEVADRIIHYLYENFIETATGEKSIILTRFFKTHPYGELDEELRAFARKLLDAPPQSPAMKCLTMLASAGIKPEWNSRKNSTGHKALPLPSGHFVEKFPMVRQLVQQLGMEVNTILHPDPKIVLDLAQKTYNVFHITEAIGSPYVPAQEEFVIPFGVRSVLGFGGILPSGNLFAIIIFSKSSTSKETADMFRALALSVKIAVLPFDNKAIFN